MEHRYRLLESAHARDLDSYNRKVTRKADGKALPRIVVLIDELADLMMSAPDVTEHNLVRLAQMARATGIHLVVATQRPSTDVVTGLIKANFPARLAFAVASSVDSRVILDYTGAESLLGKGDMLFLNPEVGNPVRAQGVMITDMEIERIISHWQKSGVEVDDVPPWETLLKESEDENEDDGLIEQAISIVRSTQRASASMIQRRLRIGYPRAARLLDQLEEMGVVGPSQGGGKERDVLLPPEDLDEEEKKK
jgi:S-DNA-T family DNA segregation ATPase FtsK/SpoIIIE